MVFDGTTPDGDPITMTCTILRLQAPTLLEHTHPAPGSSMRWELEAVDTGCILRLRHVVPDVQEAIDNCYLVGQLTDRTVITYEPVAQSGARAIRAARSPWRPTPRTGMPTRQRPGRVRRQAP